MVTVWIIVWLTGLASPIHRESEINFPDKLSCELMLSRIGKQPNVQRICVPHVMPQLVIQSK